MRPWGRTVAALGDGVSGFAVGDRVFTPTNHGQGGQGSYAEYVLASADRVAHIPQGLGFAEAAALPGQDGIESRRPLNTAEESVPAGQGAVADVATAPPLWDLTEEESHERQIA